MKPEMNEQISRFLLGTICFTAYIFIFAAVIASAFDTDLYSFLLG